MYTAAGSTTTVVLGLVLANLHTTAVTTEVELVSTTSNRGGANNVANGTSLLVKDVTIPTGSSLEILSGSKVILEAGDKIQIDCSKPDISAPASSASSTYKTDTLDSVPLLKAILPAPGSASLVVLSKVIDSCELVPAAPVAPV